MQLSIRDSKISSRIEPTTDSDLILAQRGAEELASRFNGRLVEVPLLAKSERVFGTLQLKSVVELLEPFKLLRVSTNEESVRVFFKYLDIFTERTSVGIIPITDYVLNNGYVKVELDGIEVKVARPFFLIATQANPFARTEKRTARLTYLMLEAYQKSPAEYEAELKLAIEYLGYGGRNARMLMQKMPALSGRTEFANYDRHIMALVRLIGTQMKNKIMNAAQQMGIERKSAEDAIAVTVEHFSSYKAAEEDRVEIGWEARA